jgi:serine/threonine protein kinase/tetratricopeptide (TPR) repeat protein
MSHQPARELEIFTAALQLPPASHDAFLARMCGGDQALRRRVEALLQAHAEAGDFLQPPAEAQGQPVAGFNLAGEEPGDWIGRYRLLQQIGEGGCGVVYMAEQQEPVRRRVALKIIKPGMDTKSVIARFEAERQALALMDHPNIAKVFDAGATKSGRPYFVMELVRGTKITAYCDEQALSTEDRLSLFVQVCQAVQHAHQKGVIHRDLKPSNILVTTSETGAPSPVVIDFGIAKATTNQQLTDKTLFTAFEMLIGTPAYMSPEQTALTNTDVDTRTDIYSLGVLLYELLTGSTPFDAAELLKAGLDEVRRTIREQEPLRPSARLGRMTREEQTTVAQRRHVEPPALIRSLRGDLDWIVMRALEKDRTRRYETANGLALDVQRYLADEVIAARPPSRLYRLRKLIARNRIIFVGAVIILALLITSLVVVLTLLTRERHARREAEAARHEAEADKSRAQAESDKSQQVTQFLEEMLRGVGPAVALGRNTAMLREILDNAATRIRRDLAAQPASRIQLQTVIGQVYHQLGDFTQAEVNLREAAALCRESSIDDGRQLATALAELSSTLYSLRKADEALVTARESLDLRRKLFGAESAEAANSLARLGKAYYGAGYYNESERLSQESLAIRRRLFGDVSLPVADALNNLMGDQRQLEQPTAALASGREALAIRQKLLGPEHPLVAQSLQNLANTLALNQQLDEAAETYTLAVNAWRKLGGEKYIEVTRCRMSRAFMLESAGQFTEAEAAFRELLEEQSSEAKAALSFRMELLLGHGTVLQRLHRLTEAEGNIRESLKLAQQKLPAGHSYVATICDRLAGVLLDEGKAREAETLLDELLPASFVAQPESAFLLGTRAVFYAQCARWEECIADATQAMGYRPADSRLFELLALAFAQRKNGDEYRELTRKAASFLSGADAATARRIAQACVLRPQAETGFPLLEQFAAIADKSPPLPGMTFAQCEMGIIEYRRGHYDAAVTWTERALKNAPQGLVHRRAYPLLAMAHYRLGQSEQAREALNRNAGLRASQQRVPAGEASLDNWRESIIGDLLTQEALTLLASDRRESHEQEQP